MWIYFRRRIVDAVLVIGAVGTLSFVMLHVAPGDPVAAALTDARVSASVRAHWRSVYGFDRPVLEQYGRYVASLARLDPGYSFSQHRPVSAALREALPRSILLMGLALAASVLSGVALGVWQAAHMGSWRQRTIAGALSVVAAIPDVWLALMLLTIFGAQLAWFPLNGLCDPRACSDAIGWPAFVDRLRHVALPASTVALLLVAHFARIQRVALATALGDDATRTARAKGVSTTRILWNHAMPNAFRPLVTVVGLSLPAMVGGTVFVERVFGWPGMGALLVEAIGVRDYPLVTAVTITGTVLVLAASACTDILASWLDPRIESIASSHA